MIIELQRGKGALNLPKKTNLQLRLISLSHVLISKPLNFTQRLNLCNLIGQESHVTD